MTKLVWVRWEDAFGGDGPKSVEGVRKLGPWIVESAGMLVSDDDDTLRIAQDIWLDDGGEDACRDYKIIPKKYILQMKVFNSPRLL